MQNGWIKVAAASPEIKVAQCDYNAQQVVQAVQHYAEQGVRVLVFPELCLTGYTCNDLFLQPALIRSAKRALHQIADSTKSLPMLIAVGLPMEQEGKLYNCAALLYEGHVLGIVPKTHLPNYGEFYEQRHFVPAPEENQTILWQDRPVPFGAKLVFACKQLPSFQVGIEICEDVWVPAPPSQQHAVAGATIILNLSASDETIGKDQYRRQLVSAQSAKLVAGYVYADAGQGESSTDMVFSGHHLMAENGAVLKETPPFAQTPCISEIDVERLAFERKRLNTYPNQPQPGYEKVWFSMLLSPTELTREIPRTPFVPADVQDREHRCEHILAVQSHGLKKRLQHTASQSAVVGISGGLDSCLALLVMVRAMDLLHRPRTDIVAVTMPCFGTTKRTRTNAEKLCKALGVQLRTVDITKAVLQHFEDIGHDQGEHSVVFENGQARERTQVLMDIANQTGGLVVGTGDLSELALGWATYNGDHMSMYGVNASIPKTLVRYIVQYEADRTEDAMLSEILLDILATPVSPELLPSKDGEISQKTEDLVGPYVLHDFFLYYMMRWGFPPKKIYQCACYAFGADFAPEIILRWLKVFYRRFFAQQFKRSCLPDGPKVGSVTLSPRSDWRMPSDAVADIWLQELDQL